MTKIVLTADLHYGNQASSEGTGPFDRAEHKKFAAMLHAEKPDVLIVAGDCAETAIDEAFLSEFLHVYKNPHGASLCIPGNHDMWLESAFSAYNGMELRAAGRKETWQEKYDWFFGVAKRAGWVGLRNKPWDDGNGLYVVGNMGWYDFSAIDPRVGKTAEDYERIRDWSDYGWMGLKNVMSATPMLDVNKKTTKELDQSFEKVPNERRGLVVVTHFVGLPRLMRDADATYPDDGRAYFGNFSIGEKAVRAGANLYYCGHTHFYKEFKIGETTCICNGSGYGKGSKRYDVFNV